MGTPCDQQFWCVGLFFTPPSNSPPPAECLTIQLRSDTIYPEIASDSQVRAQAWKTASPHPLRVPISSPGYYLCFWLTGYKSEVPTTHFLVQFILEHLTEIRKPAYSLGCWFITKVIKEYKSTDEEIRKVRSQKKELLFSSRLRPSGTRKPSGSTTWKFSEPPSFGFFMEASLPKHKWLNHWPCDGFNL